MNAALHELLTAHRSDIASRFASQVEREALAPKGLSRSHLIDHIPLFLEEVSEELARGTKVRFTHEASDQSPSARRHGQQRWRIGYDLEGLVREYGILRHAILEAATASGLQLSNDEFDLLAKCLNVGVAEAVTEYTRYRDEELATQKANLDFLAQAGQLLASSLDYRSTLASLTRLIVPRLADWCVIAIDGSPSDQFPIAHVSSDQVEVLRETLRRYPPLPGTPNGLLQVISTGEPALVELVSPALLEETARSPEHLSLLQQISPRSWVVVPLSLQSGTFGAMTLAWSESARNYTRADLPLIEDLARRAAVAIDNARLYELSQEERSRVEAAMRAKDEFVATVSHELRTPLHAILGWIQLIRNGSLTRTKQEHAFEVIERNAHAQNKLVDDLLDVSRAIAGRIRIASSRLDLSRIVDTTLEDSQTALNAKNIQVHTDVEPAFVLGDGERLRQVIWNLLSNAIKFTHRGGDVWVQLRTIGSDVELRVRDSGAGIDASFIPHVFETFRQSDSRATREHGGLGLGLSISQHLVLLHGGSIEAHSEGVGKGAEFVVRLPGGASVAPTTVNAAKVPATREHPTPSFAVHQQLRGVSVLIVDDEEDARELLRELLEMCEMDVRTAASVAEAMEQVDRSAPQLIISDIGMPNEDGYSLIRHLRTLPSDKRSIPAIALTAFASTEDRTRVLVAGFNRFLSKPVQAKVLLSAVADLVEGSATTA